MTPSQCLVARRFPQLWLGPLVLAVLVSAGCDNKELPLTYFGFDPADHEVFFPITSGVHRLGAPLDNDGLINCESCHAPDAASFNDVTCVACHKTMNDGLEVHSQARLDGRHAGIPEYAYESLRCVSCHPRGDLNVELDRPGHEEYFPIQTGSAHGSVACAACHVEATDRAIVTCTGCHDHDEGPMREAHGNDMIALGYAWDTASCRTCHGRSQNPGLLDHTPFPIGAGAVHEGRACIDCHLDRQDRGLLGCITCHDADPDGGADTVHGQLTLDPKHTAVTGYAWDSHSCFLCHQQAQVPGTMDHARFFPIEVGDVHAIGAVLAPLTTPIACDTCHTIPEDQRAITCTQCHTNASPNNPADILATHQSFPDYTHENSACVFCHLGGQTILDHVFFPTDPTDVHPLKTVDTPDGLNCGDCHVSKTQRTLLSCTSCHQNAAGGAGVLDTTSALHGVLGGYRYDSQACFTCHQLAQVPGSYDHEASFPLSPPSQHAGLACADCHLSRTNRSQLTCTACHLPAPAPTNDTIHGQGYLASAHDGVPNYNWTPASCIGCHPTGSADNVVFNHPDFPIAAGDVHEGIGCAGCHTVPNDFTRVDCISCHEPSATVAGEEVHSQAAMTQEHSGVPGFVYATNNCLLCHPNSEAVGIIDHDPYFPIVAPSAHAAVACNGCHVNPNDNHVVECVTCHLTVNTPAALGTVHDGIPGYAQTTVACRDCHPRGEPDGAMDHSRIFPIATGTAHSGVGCQECHASYADRANNLCATCHATVPVIPTTAHTAVRGFTNNATACKACHAQPSPVFRLTSHPRRCQGPIREKCEGSPSWTNHEGATCQNCHIDQAACLANNTCANNTAGGEVNPAATPAMVPGKPWAYDFSRFGCLGCHEHSLNRMNNTHDGENGYVSYTNPGCTHCH